jgi:predicted Rossmann fold nucleotide-binding protein DprA/Smf involved in DNA uptake
MDAKPGNNAWTCLTLDRSQNHWAQQLFQRMPKTAPPRLWVIGNRQILEQHKIGLFCSVHCPDEVIASAHRAARKLCDEDATAISGFHSPVEKECLRILLAGKRPLVICAARTLEKMRIPREWKPALENGRLLILSRFERSPRRVDTGSARRRNELVAALSDEVLIIHAEHRGQVEKVRQLVNSWGIPQRKLELTRQFPEGLNHG